MLILFDIDGTLLLSRGAGMQCFLDAGRDLFAREFRRDGLQFGGGLDPLIWRSLCALNGVSEADARAHHDRFRATYAGHLRARLDAGNLAFALPGVPELLAALADGAASPSPPTADAPSADASRADAPALRTAPAAARLAPAIGLLTGNYPETGELKLRAAGLERQQFSVAAWGCDGEHRRDLVPVALRRFSESTGRSLRGEEVVIVGDTPHDIDCAAAHGCRSLGVATGAFGLRELEACGATRAVADLSDTPDIVAWLAGPSAAR